MDNQEYSRLVTEFYRQLNVELALGKSQLHEPVSTGKLLSDFITNLNQDLAASFLSKLDVQWSVFLDKINEYPEYYWLSEQASAYVYEQAETVFKKYLVHGYTSESSSDNHPYSRIVIEALSAGPHLPYQVEKALSDRLTSFNHDKKYDSTHDRQHYKIKKRVHDLVIHFQEQSRMTENAQLKKLFDKMSQTGEKFLNQY